MEFNLVEILSLGTAVAASIVALVTIKASKKKSEAEADTAVAEADAAEAAADKAKFESYTLLINDLNDRFSKALTMLRTLEDELQRVKKENGELSLENDKLKRENFLLKEENERLQEQN